MIAPTDENEIVLTRAEAIALVVCAAEAFRSGELDSGMQAAAVAAIEKINEAFDLEIHKTGP